MAAQLAANKARLGKLIGQPAPEIDFTWSTRAGLKKISDLRGSVVVTMNTTLREQVFQIPRSFLDLLPDDAPSTVTVYAAAPEINGSKRVDADPEIYISANIQGSITLFDTITLSGFISFTAARTLSSASCFSSGSSGRPFFRLST